MDKKNIVIDLSSAFMGFWLSVCKLLSGDYNIIIVVSNSFNRKIVEDVIPDSYSVIELNSEFRIKYERSGINKLILLKKQSLEKENMEKHFL